MDLQGGRWQSPLRGLFCISVFLITRFSPEPMLCENGRGWGSPNTPSVPDTNVVRWEEAGRCSEPAAGRKASERRRLRGGGGEEGREGGGSALSSCACLGRDCPWRGHGSLCTFRIKPDLDHSLIYLFGSSIRCFEHTRNF